MSSSSSSSSTDSQRQRQLSSAYASFKHNAAIFLLVGAPILIALPPRKLDLYTLGLVGAFVASANQINTERTGRGLVSQFGHKIGHRQDPGTMATAQLLDPSFQRSHYDKQAEGFLQRDLQNQGSWKEQRLQEEQEKLDQGEGYGGMIMDQIWDVWNQKGDRSKHSHQSKETNRQSDTESRSR